MWERGQPALGRGLREAVGGQRAGLLVEEQPTPFKMSESGSRRKSGEASRDWVRVPRGGARGGFAQEQWTPCPIPVAAMCA